MVDLEKQYQQRIRKCVENYTSRQRTAPDYTARSLFTPRCANTPRCLPSSQTQSYTAPADRRLESGRELVRPLDPARVSRSPSPLDGRLRKSASEDQTAMRLAGEAQRKLAADQKGDLQRVASADQIGITPRIISGNQAGTQQGVQTDIQL